MSIPSTTTRIAIIGGGYSGVMTAVNLARLSLRPLHMTLINQGRPTARGPESRCYHAFNAFRVGSEIPS